MQTHIYRNQQSQLKAMISEPYEMISVYLETELGESWFRCQKILSKLDAIRSGKLDYWKGTSCFYTISIIKEIVIIENEMQNESNDCRVPIRRFYAIINDWKTAIEDHVVLRSRRHPLMRIHPELTNCRRTDKKENNYTHKQRAPRHTLQNREQRLVAVEEL